MSDVIKVENINKKKHSSLFQDMCKNPSAYDLVQIIVIIRSLFNRDISELPLNFYTQPHTQNNNDVQAIDFLNNSTKTVRICSSILSFFGEGGALPLAFEDLIEDMQREGESALLEFINLFYNRFIQLWFLQRSKLNPALEYKPFEDLEFVTLPYSLSGMHGVNKTYLPKAFYIQYFSTFMQTPASLSGLQEVIKGWLNIHHASHLKFSIDPFVGNWQKLTHKDDASLLGQHYNCLGHNMVIGTRMWNQSHSVLIRFESVPNWFFSSFSIKDNLEKKIIYQQLKEILTSLIGFHYDFYIVMSLPMRSVLQTKLGSTSYLGASSIVQSNTDAQKKITKYIRLN